MAGKQHKSVRRYHDRVAGRYDHSYDDAFWQWHDALTWEHLKGFLPTATRAAVLDLGCGTGKWGAKLLKSGFRVTFLDISPRMLEQARQRVAGMGADDRASFVRADLADLSTLEPSSYELVVALGEPLCCVPDPPRALREVHRVLAAGAKLVATFDNRLAAIDYYLEQGDPAELKRFLRDGRTHWLTRDADERFPIATYTPSQLERMLERAGFELLGMIGKTVLPMRHHRQLLEDGEQRRRWALVERSLWGDRDALARAPHIQLAARKLGD